MFSYLYNFFIFNPLYNGLIFLFDVIPGIDAGIAVILFTIIVRLILFPLSKKAIVTQVKMKEIEPELNRLKKTVPDRQQQALKVMELYKTKGINPFSSFFLLFLQLPIIFALYSIFMKSGLPTINEAILYDFITAPNVNMHFLGLFDISVRSIFLSVIASIAQFLQLHFSLASAKSATPSNGNSSQMDMAQNMTRNMKYIFPIMVFFISYKISAVIALYWTVTSLFTLVQELVVRRHLNKHQPL